MTTSQLVQPPHFISEVAAVLAREKPDDAQEDLRNLLDMDCQFSEDSAIYASAVDLSIRLQHHLFDTLYHDEPDAYASGETYLPPELADRQYYQPVERGLEVKIRERLAYWRELDRKARHKP